jgi:hypothetical protein
MKQVYCLIPIDGNRRTATKWKVGQLGDGGLFMAITEELSYARASEIERELRRAARKDKKR